MPRRRVRAQGGRFVLSIKRYLRMRDVCINVAEQADYVNNASSEQQSFLALFTQNSCRIGEICDR